MAWYYGDELVWINIPRVNGKLLIAISVVGLHPPRIWSTLLRSYFETSDFR